MPRQGRHRHGDDLLNATAAKRPLGPSKAGVAAAPEQSSESSASARQVIGRSGFVTGTVAGCGSAGKMADDDLICPPPIPACDHPARRLALPPLHAQLSRCRGSTCGARSGCLLRALSHEPELATRSPEVTARAHAAVAARHVRNASSLRTRSVLRDVRWRWTLNVLWTAA